MDEIWEKAVETALAGETDPETTRVLTLDGAVKCAKGHLPRPEILEKYPNLEHLSIASVGVSSLDRFPRLGKLQKLVLSDNRISGGLEFLVRAGLGSLRDLDLSNNRIRLFEDLVPLAELRLVSLDLYKCPVTKVKDYRARVFGLVKSLKYLDKMDAEENEIPESDDEEDDDDDDDDEEEGDDGEVKRDVISNGHSEEVVEEESEADEEDGDDGEERPKVMSNGHSEGVKVDEEESEADETGRQSNGVSDHANGSRGEHLNMEEEEEEDDSNEEDGEDEFEPNGLLVYEEESEPDGLRVYEEESEEEMDLLLQRDTRGEIDGHEEVAEARQPDWVSDFVANGAQDVLMNIDEEENDDSGEEDGEEDEYEPDGLIVDDTHEVEEGDVDPGVQHGNELLRNILIGDMLEEDDDESWEEEDDAEEDGEEEEEEEYGPGSLGQSMGEAIQVDEEDSDDEVQAVYSIATSNLKRKRDEEDDDGDSVSTSSYNSDDDNSSDDASSDDEDE